MRQYRNYNFKRTKRNYFRTRYNSKHFKIRKYSKGINFSSVIILLVLSLILKHTILILVSSFLIVAFVLIYCAIDIVKYYNSSYFNSTKNSIFKVIIDKGTYGEYAIYKALKSFEKNGAKFLFNAYIPKTDETTELDLIMISENGVFVFESKNYSGWIYGDENQYNWYQTLNKRFKTSFLNPIIQNKTHIKYLKELIEINVPIYSIIVFSNRCVLKNVTYTSECLEVIHRRKVFDTINSIIKHQNTKIITIENVYSLFSKLSSFTGVDDIIKSKHIRNIKEKTSSSKNASVQINEQKCTLKNTLDQSNTSEKCLSNISINTTNETDSNINNTVIDPSELKNTIDSSTTNNVDKNIIEHSSTVNELHPDNSKSIRIEKTEATDNYSSINIVSKKCPNCKGALVIRTAKKGDNIGKEFLGCSNFPKCRYTEKIPYTQ